jgi:hypothetical protein
MNYRFSFILFPTLSLYPCEPCLRRVRSLKSELAGPESCPSLLSQRELDEDGSGGGCPTGARQELEEINGRAAALAPGHLSPTENLGKFRSDSYVAHGPDPVSSRVKSPTHRRHTRPPTPEKIPQRLTDAHLRCHHLQRVKAGAPRLGL